MSSSLGNFLESFVASSLLVPNIFLRLSTLFLNTLNPCYSCRARDQVSHLYKAIAAIIAWCVLTLETWKLTWIIFKDTVLPAQQTHHTEHTNTLACELLHISHPEGVACLPLMTRLCPYGFSRCSGSHITMCPCCMAMVSGSQHLCGLFILTSCSNSTHVCEAVWGMFFTG
jgi:hypothetical protein